MRVYVCVQVDASIVEARVDARNLLHCTAAVFTEGPSPLDDDKSAHLGHAPSLAPEVAYHSHLCYLGSRDQNCSLYLHGKGLITEPPTSPGLAF